MELVIIGGLALALIVVLVLWQMSLTGKREARQALEQAQAELERAGNDFAELNQKLGALSAHTSLSEFPHEIAYQLLAKGSVLLKGDSYAFGVVRDENGNDLTFLTRQDIGHLEPNDNFTSVLGQLAKLGEGALKPRPAAPPLAPAAPVNMDDATVPVSASPSRAADATEPMHAAPKPAAAPPPPPPAMVDDDDDDEDDMDKTVMFLPDRDKPKKKDDNAGLPYLKVLEGPDKGTSFPLHFDSSTIGREQGNAITLSDTGSSRTHCVVDYAGASFRLRDNNSTNGTVLNGEKITEKQLEFGDRIKVADTTMMFTCKGHDLKESNPGQAIKAFEETLEREPNFLAALKNLAFLLERDIARQKDAQPMWEKIMKLEKQR